MTRKFRPFDIVRLSESYIHELRSAPRLRFPAEVILERISEERSEPKRYDYESLVGIVAETDGEQASVV